MAVADVTGDGKLDALVGDTQAGAPFATAVGIRVLRGDGAGGFGASYVVPVVTAPAALEGPIDVADVNGDGIPDIVVAAATGSNPVDNGLYVIPGLGSGAFGSAVRVVDLPSTEGWNVGDVGGPTGPGGTGLPDIVSVSPDRTAVRVWVNAGTPGDGMLGFAHAPGDFIPAFPTGCPITISAAQVLALPIADVNADAKPDIVLVGDQRFTTDGCSVDASIQVFAGDGSGRSFTPTAYSPVQPLDPVVDDFTGDGRLDVATGSGRPNAEVLAGLPGGGLNVPSPPPTTGNTNTQPMALADLDGNGATDIVGVNDRLGSQPHLSYELGSATGLAPSSVVAIPSAPSALVRGVAAADLNGDGVPDLVAQLDDGRVAVLLNKTAVPPSVSAEFVASAEGSSATVGATVNPHATPTHYHVEWGSQSGAYPNVGPDLPASGALDGSTPMSVTAGIGGLSVLTQYHWRIVATNAAGTTFGTDETLFTNLPIPRPHRTVSITPPGPTGVGDHGVWTVDTQGQGAPIVSYGWDWNNDGKIDTHCDGSSPLGLHTFSVAGAHTVAMTMTTADGGSVTVSAQTVIDAAHAIHGLRPDQNGGACAVPSRFDNQQFHDSKCTTHVEWELITADIVGQTGCFEDRTAQRPLNETCVPGICGTAASTGDPLNEQVSPALWEVYRKTNAKILTAFPDSTDSAVKVKVNGVIISAKSVVIDELYNAINANEANVDLAPAADGTVAATPLGRHVTVSTRLPIQRTFPSTFASTRRAVAANPSAAPDATTNPCDDPAVQSEPLLGQFDDPKTAGFTPDVGGLHLGGGPIMVHVVDGHVIVCANISLPTTPCFASSSSSGVSATLLADQGGLLLQNLRAHLDCAVIADVVFSNVSFSYQADGKQWAAKGTVAAIPGLPLSGSVEFARGDFVSASVGAQPTFLLLGPLQLKNVDIGVYPDRTTGNVTFDSVPNIPGINAAPLTIAGDYVLSWGTYPGYFRVSGQASLVGIPVANGQLEYDSDNTVHAKGNINAGIAGVITARVDVKADFWALSPLRFNAEGDGDISILDALDLRGQLLVSNIGAGACVEIKEGPFHLHVGATVHWSPFAVHPMFDSCDISGVRESGAPAALVHSARAAHDRAKAFAVPVAPHTGYAVIGVTASGGPPAVALDGPKGEHVLAPTGAPKSTVDELVVHDTQRATTYVVLRAPSAGSWTVSALAGSPPIRSVGYAHNLPPVSVTAHVTRNHSTYRLLYKIAKIPGQTVQFVERGQRDLAGLGRIRVGGAGSLAFTPPAGAAGRREILAIVSQDDHVRTQLVAARYTAPGPRRPAKPHALHAGRHGSQLVVTWKRVPGAAAYLAEIRTSDGRSPVILTTHPRVSVALVAPDVAAAIQVRALSGRHVGDLASPTAKTSLSALRLALTHVSARQTRIHGGPGATVVSVTLNRLATVHVALQTADGRNDIATIVRRLAPGIHTVRLVVTGHGRALKPGRYLVVVTAKSPGFEPAIRATALRASR